jgi:hypothetical protein
VLVDGVDDPVNTGIIADVQVLRIDQHHLEVLIGGVLVHPVKFKIQVEVQHEIR